MLPPDQALGLGLILHELASNALKYGALSVSRGHVEFGWQMTAPQVLRLLTQYAQSGDEAKKNPQLMDCITSWIREVPLHDIFQHYCERGTLDARNDGAA